MLYHVIQELAGRHAIGSPEFQSMLSRETARIESSHKEELRRHQDRIDELAEKYAALEDEFRLALQLEADRFKQVRIFVLSSYSLNI